MIHLYTSLVCKCVVYSFPDYIIFFLGVIFVIRVEAVVGANATVKFPRTCESTLATLENVVWYATIIC